MKYSPALDASPAPALNGARPLNIPLIAITLVLVIVGKVGKMNSPTNLSAQSELVAGVITLALSPVFILWVRALWNTLVPRITGWREVTFWEAAGVTALLALVV